MESCTGKINGRSVSQTANDVRMTNAIEGNRLVLEILNQGVLKIGILITLEQDVERFDDDFAKTFIGGASVTGHVNLSVTAAAQTVLDVVTSVKSAL
jgi:hypothetical protein